MDIGYIRQKHGHRVTLLGNVDWAHTLVHGSRQPIIDETVDVIKNRRRAVGLCSAPATLSTVVSRRRIS
jgi:hypothetical protein